MFWFGYWHHLFADTGRISEGLRQIHIVSFAALEMCSGSSPWLIPKLFLTTSHIYFPGDFLYGFYILRGVLCVYLRVIRDLVDPVSSLWLLFLSPSFSLSARAKCLRGLLRGQYPTLKPDPYSADVSLPRLFFKYLHIIYTPSPYSAIGVN